MKVFKMNDCDWVVAKNIAEAIKWYENWTGFDWVQDQDINPIECDIDAPIKYTPDIYNDPVRTVDTTFRELIKLSEELYPNQREPYIILSTEY